jgi:CHAT domain-containing protein
MKCYFKFSIFYLKKPLFLRFFKELVVLFRKNKKMKETVMNSIFNKCLFLVLAIFVASNPSGASDKELLASIDKVPASPKTIDDLVKLLDAAKPDASEIQKHKDSLAAKVPENATKEQLNAFYRERGRAAEFLGLPKLLAENCKKELEYANPDNRDQFLDAHNSCIQAEFLDGNMQGAIKRINEALATPHGRQLNGWSLTFQLLLVNANRQLGDLQASDNAIREVDGIITIMRRWNSWSEWGNHWTYQAERARGEYLSTTGKPVAAELSFVRASTALQARIDAFERGDYKSSTRKVHSKQGIYFNKGIVQARMANALFAQRRLSEAEYYYRSALKTFLEVGTRNTPAVSGVLSGLSQTVAEQGRTQESLILSRYALNSTIESGVADYSTQMIYARRSHAAALVNNEKFTEAAQQFALIKSSIAKDEFMTERFKRVNDLDEVVALIFSKQAPQAEVIAKDMYESSLKINGQNHPRTGWTQAFYAMSLEEQGKTKEARANFSKAMPVLIDQTRNDAENQTISLKYQKRFAILVESYIGVLFHAAKETPVSRNALIAEAFQLADMARGSSVQRAMTQSTARANIKNPALEFLARKEQDLQRRANSLNDLLVALSAAPPERQLPAVQAKMKADIEAIKAERNSVKKDIENKFPEYFDLVEPKPITIDRTAKVLKPKEVLVTWYFGDRKSYVWAIHNNGLSSFSDIPLNKADVGKDVEKLRKALDPGVASIEEIPAFDVALSYKLYTQLIKPVESSLIGKDLLISIPHLSLGQLPIATLLTEAMKQPTKGAKSFAGYQNAPWLMRKIAISQLPSVNALAALRGMPKVTNAEQSFIAFADPYFSKEQAKTSTASSSKQLATRGIPLKLRNAPKTSNVSSAELALLPGLPDTSLEVNEIGKVLNAKEGDIFLHEKASVAQVLKTDFSKKSIVMFSTHGLVPGELDGLLQPALALSSPDVTGEKEGDGLLTMDKILELKLNADWVVLSACNTATGDGNAEAVSGLGRAFFYAGARALLVSNWPVDTVASRELMIDLFKRQQTKDQISKAESLRQAMVSLADNAGAKDAKTNTMIYSYAHPLFWAPFVVVGD